MPQVLIKKFTLRHNGQDYKAGNIINLSEAEAAALVASAPKEFEKVVVRNIVAAAADSGGSADQQDKPTAEKALKEHTNDELKQMCGELGIDVPKNANKAKLVELLEKAADEDDAGSSLPPVDTAATVK